MKVPDRFVRTVVTHAIAVAAIRRYPLMLAVVGPPGDGKSFQTAASLSHAGFAVFPFSSADLGGTTEARPIEQLRRLYGRARDAHAIEPRRYPALILEDFDLSPAGQSRGTRYTVNSQLLTGYLMNLADDVSMCDVGTDLRFPVFLTTNDLSTLHGPLMRPGRMNIFGWEPDAAERTEMILSILSNRLLDGSDQEVAALARKYGELPISAFASAVTDCVADHVYRQYNGGVVDIALAKKVFGADLGFTLQDFDGALQQRVQATRQKRNGLLRGWS